MFSLGFFVLVYCITCKFTFSIRLGLILLILGSYLSSHVPEIMLSCKPY